MNSDEIERLQWASAMKAPEARRSTGSSAPTALVVLQWRRDKDETVRGCVQLGKILANFLIATRFFLGMRTASTLKTGRKKQGIVQRDWKQKRVSQRLRRENLRASWSEKWSASANWTPAGTQVVMAVCGTAHTALGIIQKKKKKRKAWCTLHRTLHRTLHHTLHYTLRNHPSSRRRQQKLQLVRLLALHF